MKHKILVKLPKISKAGSISLKKDKRKEIIQEFCKYLPFKISKKKRKKTKTEKKLLNFKLKSFKLSESLNGVSTHHCIHSCLNIKFQTLGKTAQKLK